MKANKTRNKRRPIYRTVLYFSLIGYAAVTIFLKFEYYLPFFIGMVARITKVILALSLIISSIICLAKLVIRSMCIDSTDD